MPETRGGTEIIMPYDWLDRYLLDKPGVTKDYKVEWHMTRYMVAGKQFASFGGDKEGKPIYTFKLEPAFSVFLRGQYPCIVPGYYCNKEHWSSMYLDGGVPDDIVRDMADDSYRQILNKLPKKIREALPLVSE